MSRGELGANYFMGVSGNFNRAIEKKYYVDCFTDMTRLRLAILEYRRDHGALPDSLNALAPKYIDVLPYDRFDGKSLRYDRERKILYSAGMNFKDDKGAFKNTISDKTSWKDMREEKDIALRIAK